MYAGCLSHKPSLMSLAPTSLLFLSGRASDVIGLTPIGRTRSVFSFFEYAWITD